MIRLLTQEDDVVTKAFLLASPHYNLYMLGNVEKLGFGQAFCQFWGDFSQKADGPWCLRAVLNRYMSGWNLYGLPDADWPGLAGIVDAHPEGATRFQDNPGGVISFLPYLARYQSNGIDVEELMDLPIENFQPSAAPTNIDIRLGTLADLSQLIRFYGDAGHMTRSPAAVERPLRDTRLWLAEENGTILSAALTNAETEEYAMIGGVYTPPSQRGRGLSQAVCSALCRDLFAAGKRPVLYWSTPAAGAVYRKLGFRALGQWRSVWLSSKA